MNRIGEFVIGLQVQRLRTKLPSSENRMRQQLPAHSVSAIPLRHRHLRYFEHSGANQHQRAATDSLTLRERHEDMPARPQNISLWIAQGSPVLLLKPKVLLDPVFIQLPKSGPILNLVWPNLDGWLYHGYASLSLYSCCLNHLSLPS